MALAIDDLITPLTKDEVLQTLIDIGVALGLPATAWQVGSVGRTVIELVAQKIADFTRTTSAIARGGFLDLAIRPASDQRDSNGAVKPGFIDLLASSVYQVVRAPATFAAGLVVLTNASLSPYTFAVGDLHVANATTGRTYTNTASATLAAAVVRNIASSTNASPIAVTTAVNHGYTTGDIVVVAGHLTNTNANGTWTITVTGAATFTLDGSTGNGVGGATGTAKKTPTVSVNVQADAAGAASSSGPGTIRALVNSILGVSVTNADAFVGVDAESDEQLAQSCRDKLASLSPGGPKGAYAYYAKKGRDGKPLAGVVNPVTRVWIPPPDSGNGNVTVYLASDIGAVAGVDLTIPDDSIQQNAVPAGITATVLSASDLVIAPTYEVWVKSESGLTQQQVKDKISTALATFMKGFKIGGATIPPAVTGVIAFSAIEGEIYRALDSDTRRGDVIKVDLTVPAADVVLAQSEVGKLGAITATVNFVSTT